MTQKITFRSVTDYNEPCKVEIEIITRNLQRPSRDWETLEEIENREVLSICGKVYTGRNLKHLVCCGQISDCFKCQTPAQKKLVEFWKKHHLNDLKAGTKAQTELLEEYRKTAINKYDYTAECKYLEERNMLVDRGYKYGTSWLCTTFPKDELLTIIQELENETA
jgi:hypothetical protein